MNEMTFKTKGDQIEGLAVIFQMHIIAKIFDINKYLKNQKSQKLKKKRKEKENRENYPKRSKFFSRLLILKTKRKK